MEVLYKIIYMYIFTLNANFSLKYTIAYLFIYEGGPAIHMI